MVIKKKEQTFNRKQRYINRSGKRIGQGVWYDENGHMIKPGEAVYDKDTHLVTQCNMDGTKTVYTREQWHKKKTKDHETRVLQNDRKWSIPYLPEKEMTLTIDTDSPTRRNDGITFSENVLDSIAINAQRAGIPFSTGLALASTESTIGNAKGRGVGTTVLPWMRVLNQSKDSYKQGAKKISYDGVYSPTALISNWKQRAENPYYDYEYTDKGQLRTTYQPESFYKKDFRPSVNKDTDYVFDNKSPLQHGFEKYREDPHKYNYGDPHYSDKVEANRQELIHYSPEIKAYMQKNNLKADGGSLDNTWNSLSLKDKAEMIKVAARNGITTLPEVKKAYNKFAEGGPKEPWTMQDEADKAYGSNLFKDGGKKTSTTDNSQRAMNYLKSKGMNHIAASAIIGTLQAESGMNPAIHAQMKGDTGEGLAQWTGSRKNKFWSTLEKIEPGARKRYGSIVNVPLERQLDVVMSERPDIIFAINNANDIHTATDLMLRGYENGGGNIDSLASKSQMNSIYGKWNNGYDRQFNTRLNYAKNLLGADPSQYTLSQNALDAVNTEINDIDLSKLSTSGLPLFGVPGMDNNPATSYKAPVIIQEEEPKAASIAEFKYDPQEERLDNMRTMSNAFSMMGIENPFMDTFRQVDSYSNNPLMAIANISAYGGNLYANGGEKASITAKPSRRYSLKNNILGQQTVYKDGDEYYVLDKNSHRIPLTRDGEWGNSGDPSTWQFKDANGKTYSPQGTHYGESIISQEKGLVDAPMTLKTINGLLNLPFEGLSYVATGDGLQHNLPEEGDALLDMALYAPVLKGSALALEKLGEKGITTAYNANRAAIENNKIYKTIAEIIDDGSLGDPYTTFRGRLGTYGNNLFSNLYGTVARNFNLPDKARIPADAIRKIKGDVSIKDGLVDLTGTKNFLGNPHINVTLDRPVVSHSAGAWDGADTYLFPTKDLLEQTYPSALKSIEPSDVFANGTKVMEKPQNVTLISGDINALENAQKAGMQTLSSPRLRRLYQESKAVNPKEIGYWSDYATEVQRLQSKRGTPTLEDFRLLENTTGLNSGVAPIADYENAINAVEEMHNTLYNNSRDIINGIAAPYVFPNGRQVEWSVKGIRNALDGLKRAKYNKVFYDPTTYGESEWLYPSK